MRYLMVLPTLLLATSCTQTVEGLVEAKSSDKGAQLIEL
ncbi:MAG: hypothetical protein M2R45_01011 [Verrucomicrobia subdivision 3 bacterium]|nr:hypothetical protein [Limisphaerales bacterium]MCS1414123.1 hypothetical protein [Limisphaerales bacterium]